MAREPGWSGCPAGTSCLLGAKGQKHCISIPASATRNNAPVSLNNLPASKISVEGVIEPKFKNTIRGKLLNVAAFPESDEEHVRACHEVILSDLTCFADRRLRQIT